MAMLYTPDRISEIARVALEQGIASYHAQYPTDGEPIGPEPKVSRSETAVTFWLQNAANVRNIGFLAQCITAAATAQRMSAMISERPASGRAIPQKYVTFDASALVVPQAEAHSAGSASSSSSTGVGTNAYGDQRQRGRTMRICVTAFITIVLAAAIFSVISTIAGPDDVKNSDGSEFSSVIHIARQADKISRAIVALVWSWALAFAAAIYSAFA